MFQHDWILRQIEEYTRFISKIIFNKKTSVYDLVIDEYGNYTPFGDLYIELRTLINNGEINKAENLLFEKINQNPDLEYLEIALDFYTQINRFDDKYLEEHDFSRDEIKDGLKSLKKIYEYDDCTIDF